MTQQMKEHAAVVLSTTARQWFDSPYQFVKNLILNGIHSPDVAPRVLGSTVEWPDTQAGLYHKVHDPECKYSN